MLVIDEATTHCFLQAAALLDGYQETQQIRKYDTDWSPQIVVN